MFYYCFILTLFINIVFCSDDGRLLDAIRDISLEALDDYIDGIDERSAGLQCLDCSDEATCSSANPPTCTSASGKCFVRQDPNGLIYRGCAVTGWPNVDNSFVGCKDLKEGGWIVEGGFKAVKWCLCDSNDLCNKESIESLSGLNPATETSNGDNRPLTVEEMKDLTGRLEQRLTEAADEAKEFIKVHEAHKKEFFDQGVDKKHTSGPKALHLAFLKTKPAAARIARIGCEIDDTTHRLTTKLNLTASHCIAIPHLGIVAPFRCPFQEKICCDGKEKYRKADGKCNNIDNPLWGAALTPFRRFIVPSYGDYVNSPRTKGKNNKDLPNARFVSTAVHRHPTSMDVDDRYTHMLMQWGQFLDHDIDASAISKGYDGSDVTCCPDNLDDDVKHKFSYEVLRNRGECFPITIPKNDSHFKTTTCMDFARSAEAPNSKCTLGYREQLNQITSYIDASNVYGSSKEEQEKLRDDSGGKLKTSNHPSEPEWLPKDEHNEGACQLPVDKPEVKCIFAGDERANEQAGLTTMHTIWVRKHNQIAKELAKLNPHWDDEKLFEESRKIIGALMQHITYHEFLPLLFGKKGLETYSIKLKRRGYFTGYDKEVDGSIRNSFATAAYRMGHSLINNVLSRLTDKYEKGNYTSPKLRDVFFNPESLYSDGGIDTYARGLVFDNTSKRDALISDELTNHLFEDPVSKIGLDLAALNIQRGRDHGLPSYNAFRHWCTGNYTVGKKIITLVKATSFDDLNETHTPEIISSIKHAYKDGHVDDIDVFTGSVSEKSVKASILGPTLSCILGKQFQLLRVGDRFWYETGDKHVRFTPKQLKTIRRVTLSRILCDTVDSMKTIQPMAFVLPIEERGNQHVECKKLPALDLTRWRKKTRNGREYDEDEL